MDFLKNSLTQNKPADSAPGEAGSKHPSSTSELLSDAKTVADAAKSAMNRETDKVDKKKAAGAAENLLDAASSYGKLEEKGMGSYVQKAQDYLHKYGSSEHSSAAPPQSEEKKEGGADYMKAAEGLFNRH